jgi:hypothetical protein
MGESDIPKTFDEKWYDKNYFKTVDGKKFKRANGSIAAWSYSNPTGEFTGAKQIAQAWKKIFQPKNMLDVGAGRGTVVAYARDAGIEAVGFDFSEWACSNEGRYPRCKAEWLKCHNATKPWPYESRSFDLVVALDFFEHIYATDLDFVINEMFRVANKWIFLQIATAAHDMLGEQKSGYIFKKGQTVPLALEGCAVAGHVTVQPPDFWLSKFDSADWLVRRDMVNWFVSLVDNNIIRNWLLNTILVLERI